MHRLLRVRLHLLLVLLLRLHSGHVLLRQLLRGKGALLRDGRLGLLLLLLLLLWQLLAATRALTCAQARMGSTLCMPKALPR